MTASCWFVTWKTFFLLDFSVVHSTLAPRSRTTSGLLPVFWTQRDEPRGQTSNTLRWLWSLRLQADEIPPQPLHMSSRGFRSGLWVLGRCVSWGTIQLEDPWLWSSPDAMHVLPPPCLTRADLRELVQFPRRLQDIRCWIVVAVFR